MVSLKKKKTAFLSAIETQLVQLSLINIRNGNTIKMYYK